jgi:hypothetical protein
VTATLALASVLPALAISASSEPVGTRAGQLAPAVNAARDTPWRQSRLDPLLVQTKAPDVAGGQVPLSFRTRATPSAQATMWDSTMAGFHRSPSVRGSSDRDHYSHAAPSRLKQQSEGSALWWLVWVAEQRAPIPAASFRDSSEAAESPTTPHCPGQVEALEGFDGMVLTVAVIGSRCLREEPQPECWSPKEQPTRTP